MSRRTLTAAACYAAAVLLVFAFVVLLGFAAALLLKGLTG